MEFCAASVNTRVTSPCINWNGFSEYNNRNIVTILFSSKNAASPLLSPFPPSFSPTAFINSFLLLSSSRYNSNIALSRRPRPRPLPAIPIHRMPALPLLPGTNPSSINILSIILSSGSSPSKSCCCCTLAASSAALRKSLASSWMAGERASKSVSPMLKRVSLLPRGERVARMEAASISGGAWFGR